MADYPPTPSPCTAEENEQEIENKCKSQNDFNFISNKNNTFNVTFKNYSNYIEINSFSNNEFYSKYKKRYYLKELKTNKFLSICDSIDEIYQQLIIELKKENKKTIIEDNKNITILIPVDHIKVKEIKFILEEEKGSKKEIIQDLYEESKKVKKDNTTLIPFIMPL